MQTELLRTPLTSPEAMSRVSWLLQLILPVEPPLQREWLATLMSIRIHARLMGPSGTNLEKVAVDGLIALARRPEFRTLVANLAQKSPDPWIQQDAANLLQSVPPDLPAPKAQVYRQNALAKAA
jgi:hypothetical protein